MGIGGVPNTRDALLVSLNKDSSVLGSILGSAFRENAILKASGMDVAHEGSCDPFKENLRISGSHAICDSTKTGPSGALAV